MTEQSIPAFDPAGLHTLEVIAGADRFNKWLFSQFEPLLKGKILEIGSGIGNLSQIVLDCGFQLTLSDFNPGYADYLKKRFTGHSQVEDVLQVDLIHPQFTDAYRELENKFDSIFLLNVIEHIKDDTKAVENCRFLLKPGGHLILLAPAWQWLYCNLDRELGHYRRYTLQRLSSLVTKNEFSLLKKQYFNFLGVIGWLVSGKLLRNKLLGKNEMSAFNKLVLPAKIIDQLVFRKAGLSVIVAGKK